MTEDTGPKDPNVAHTPLKDFDSGAAQRAGARLVESTEFKEFTRGWGLYEKDFGTYRIEQYKDYLREFIGDKGYISDKELPEAFYTRYRQVSAVVGNMIHTELKAASHEHFGSKCEYCSTGVYDEKMETTVSTLGRLSEVNEDPHPNLVFDNNFVLTCNSCGGPTENIDLSPATRWMSVNMVEPDGYYWPFQKKDQLVGADLKFAEFVNTAILRPYQEGKEIFVNRMVQKLRGEEE